MCKHDMGVSVKCLSEEYGVSTSTVYDLKKQKEQTLQFYGGSDVPKLVDKRKMLHQPKTADVDNVFIEWIRQCRLSNFSLGSCNNNDTSEKISRQIRPNVV